MSRCFPFSPTGYERKTNDHLDSQAEEKRKEKKRKKEKREGKDRYKEKKSQKETHKDYKKKDRKDRSSIRNGRPDKQSQSPDGNLLGENNHKPKQINHFKDFDWGIKDEQKVAANRKDDNFKFPAHKSIRSLAAATAMVKESVASHRTFPSSSEEINQSKFKVLDREIKDDSKTEENQKVRNFNIPVQKSVGTMDKKRSADHKAFPSSAVAPQRQIGSMERPADNFHNSTPKRNEGMVSKSEIQKEKNAMEKLVSMLISTRQRGNGGVSLLMENLDGSIHRRFKGSSPATSVEIDDCNNNKVAIISNNSVQRTINGMGHSANRLSVHKNVNSSFPVKIEDRANKDRMVARNDGMGGLVEKDANNGIQEGKSKNKEREACGKREEKYKNQDLDKKDKDKDKHKGKEKEKVKVKKDKEQKEPRDDRKKNQLDALRLKPLASQINNAKNNIIDENIKKRKEIEKNSIHNDTNFRPNKTQNTNFSTPLCEENGTLESSDIVFPRLKPEAIGNKLSLNAIDQEECIKNSITKTQSSSALSMYPVAAKTDMTKVGATPHPDCVYLDRLYTIPKVDGYPEYDDQEWVFSSCHDRKSNSKLQANANEVPQVWSETIKIESENVLAMPYVVPF
ncbi:bromodomain-containing protein DDB_G0270170-like [Zingiber officinale]|uniref:bromodomain-containing protein DDB_G0270170-like n=1 Tax=Zingiber officinale TaxID=94328 RepID=UPI001C4DC7FF|nr:bromodomain-containing protein DDB_G0270170-like [Zingiber officinale]